MQSLSHIMKEVYDMSSTHGHLIWPNRLRAWLRNEKGISQGQKGRGTRPSNGMSALMAKELLNPQSQSHRRPTMTTVFILFMCQTARQQHATAALGSSGSRSRTLPHHLLGIFFYGGKSSESSKVDRQILLKSALQKSLCTII